MLIKEARWPDIEPTGAAHRRSGDPNTETHTLKIIDDHLIGLQNSVTHCEPDTVQHMVTVRLQDNL